MKQPRIINTSSEGFRVNTKIRRQLAARKKRLDRRIDKHNNEGCERPMLRPGNIQYELAERTQGLAYGGIGAMRLLVQELGLPRARMPIIDYGSSIQ